LILIEAPVRIDGLDLEAAAEVVVAVGVAVTIRAKRVKAIAEMAEVNFMMMLDIWLAWEVDCEV
jgi:hypothetical protein